MAIKGMVLKDAATSMTVVGGSDMTFTEDGVQVANGVHVSNAANTDFLTRENCTFKYRPPTQKSDGSWTKGKCTMIYVEPGVDANGKMKYDLGRVELELDPTSAATVGTNICFMLGQMLTQAATLAFRTSGSLA